MRRTAIAAVVCSLAFAGGCADMKEKVREKECASDWSGRGFQAGQAGAAIDAEISRHSAHCPNFDTGAFKEGYQKGFARRARPPV